MDLLKATRDRAAAAGGTVLALATRATATVRPAAKPLHPSGRVVRARLDRHGLDPGLGAPFLDEAGTDQVLVRLSRAVGLPRPFPDFHGLAVRVPLAGGRHGDLLLATTGRGAVTRFLLTPSRTPGGRPMTTLLPYRTPTGAVLLGAQVVDDRHVTLSCAPWRGPWQEFGELTLAPDDVGDPGIDFDPVRHQVPGLEVPGWVSRLRAPAYRQARSSRT